MLRHSLLLEVSYLFLSPLTSWTQSSSKSISIIPSSNKYCNVSSAPACFPNFQLVAPKPIKQNKNMVDATATLIIQFPCSFTWAYPHLCLYYIKLKIFCQEFFVMKVTTKTKIILDSYLGTKYNIVINKNTYLLKIVLVIFWSILYNSVHRRKNYE